MKDWLQNCWWQTTAPPRLLRPLSWLYGAIADGRAARQRAGAKALPVPVIVVGNIAVGGTGKTPITLWLVEQLLALGESPGVISRGYGGKGPFPLLVTPETTPERCGDEPLLIARRSRVPVCVAPARTVAGECLLQAHPKLTVLICDDGMQHYALQRQMEFCVIDGSRGHGNGWRLPAGPLREPTSRMQSCDWLLVNGGPAAGFGAKALRFDLQQALAVNLKTGAQQPLREFVGSAVHAVAGIGNPERFFAQLEAQGMSILRHNFVDHHAYHSGDLAFGDTKPILMTEKDAVKCQAFAEPHHWAVPVAARFNEADESRVQQSLKRLFIRCQ